MRKLEIANGAEQSLPLSLLSHDWFSGALLETLPAAVYVCNVEAVVVAYNRRAAELVNDGDTRTSGRHCQNLCEIRGADAMMGFELV